jgi:DNA polymerase
VFIANMIKCRPPQNRDPLPAELSACNHYLERQIELVNPKLIVTLGRFSMTRFFPGESISRARGQVREKASRFIYPVMHPAAALRRQELRVTLVQDFKAIPAILAGLGQAPQNAPAEDQQEAPPPEQLNLF